MSLEILCGSLVSNFLCFILMRLVDINEFRFIYVIINLCSIYYIYVLCVCMFMYVCIYCYGYFFFFIKFNCYVVNKYTEINGKEKVL